MKAALHKVVAGWSPANSQHSVLILNKPPTTELKFTSILSRHSDGTVIMAQEFKNQIALHHQWQDVEFWGKGPSLLKRKDKPIPEASILVVSVVDDEKGSVGRRLMNMKVDFWGESRICRRWIQKNHVPRCTICQRWGHTTLACYTGDRKCLKCGEAHAVQRHEQNCETCKKGKGSVCAPKCTNCNGPHFADSNDCPFWQARYSRNNIEALYTKLKKERMEATRAEWLMGKKPNTKSVTIKLPAAGTNQGKGLKQMTLTNARASMSKVTLDKGGFQTVKKKGAKAAPNSAFAFPLRENENMEEDIEDAMEYVEEVHDRIDEVIEEDMEELKADSKDKGKGRASDVDITVAV